MATPEEAVKLSKSCTVADYRNLVTARDQTSIAAFVVERFEERYLDALAVDPSNKNGFAIMAVSCLMIEALESFYRGWTDSRGKSELAFCSFFSRCDAFDDFRSVAGPFYRHVRCGILHQAETTGGWRIVRRGPLRIDRTINATKFAKALRHVLHEYASSLRRDNWDSAPWQAFRKKMNAVCRNAIG
jgi:hypothetical protein